MTEHFALHPIGVVRSPFATTHAIPLHGGPATLEINADYADALEGLEGSSHLVVMGYLHLADRSVLKSRPVKLDPQAPPRGVFATRSPARPNPISMTVVPLLHRDGLRLEVDRLDLVDGTPLIDLKAYAPGWDSVFCACHRHRTSPQALDDRRLSVYLERDLINFMGHAAQYPSARWGLAAAFVGARALRVDPRDPSLRVLVNRRDATTEALMALTGAALFNQRLTTVPDGASLLVRFEYAAKRVELVALHEVPPPDFGSWEQAFAITITNV